MKGLVEKDFEGAIFDALARAGERARVVSRGMLDIKRMSSPLG